MVIKLSNCEWVLLNEIEELKLTQPHVAQTYAFAIDSGKDIDWQKVNDAIINRWSLSGLERVKKMAWEMLENKEEPE